MADTFALRIITPDKIFYEGDVVMAEFNTTEGGIGIYKNHMPITVIIRPGVMTITETEGEKKAALHAGFVEILQDKVTILAESIEWPDEIDVERAQSAEERARERIASKAGDVDIDAVDAARTAGSSTDSGAAGAAIRH